MSRKEFESNWLAANNAAASGGAEADVRLEVLAAGIADILERLAHAERYIDYNDDSDWE